MNHSPKFDAQPYMDMLTGVHARDRPEQPLKDECMSSLLCQLSQLLNMKPTNSSMR